MLTSIVLAGCDSTQQKNARAELRAKRELASRELTRVGRQSPDVRVERVALVRGKRSSAIVVELRSTAPKALTDVPIAVGVRGSDGSRRVVNAKRRLNWFQTHVPAIPAGGAVTWLFKGARGVEAGDRAFAKVGVPATPAISSAGSLPRIDVAAASTARRGGTRRVVVENTSDVPQYDLQVYAFAIRRGRYVAAGKTEIEHLGTGQRVTAAVPLSGSADRRPLRAEAIPTMFE